MPPLPDEVHELAKGANFATVVTLRADGHPASQVMWIDCDDECLIVNTEIHRRKFQNLQRDPRATVTIWESGNPYRYVEVRGTVEEVIRGEAARKHIDDLAWKYFGRLYDPAIITSERVMVRIRPLAVSKSPS